MDWEMAPDRFWRKLYQGVKSSWKTAFLSAVIIGVVTHIYAMTNNLLTWDSLWNLYSDQDMLSSARPFLTYLCGISSYFNLPLVNGVLGICYLGFSAAVIAEIFHIESPVFLVLISGLLVTFPTIVATICYMYTFDGYMLALLLSLLAFPVTERKKHGWILGGFLLAVSIGTYQAYFSVTIVVCILSLLLALIEDEWKIILKKVKNDMLMGIFGYALYVVSVLFMQAAKAVELSRYSGTDRVVTPVLEDLPRGIYMAYRNFGSFAIVANVLTANGFMRAAFYTLAAMCVVLYSAAFIQRGRIKDMARIFFAALLVALLPLGATIFCVLFPDTFVHLLMRMPWVLLLMFPLVLAERYTKSNGQELRQKAALMCQWLCAAASFLMVFNFFLVSNIVYYNMNERYEKSYALCVRIADRIEQTEGYYAGMTAAFLGGLPDDTQYPHSEETSWILRGYYAAGGDYFFDRADAYISFLKHYSSIHLQEAPLEKQLALSQTEAVENMGVFPAQDSVRVIDDVLVVKMRG